MSDALLEIDQLRVDLPVAGELRTVLHDVSLSVAPGEALGLVGESGSGKSLTVRAAAGLLPAGARWSGRITIASQDIATASRTANRRLRSEFALVFQDPRSHFNPVRTIGDFTTEVLRLRGVGRREAVDRSVRALREVGIGDGQRRLNQYPHELSGGLLQRVMIATALLAEPRLLLADEPTTALDVTTQAEVMAILNDLRRERGLALLFITHDLDLADAVCDRTAVMYAGRIVEVSPSASLHGSPLHPYTAALTGARPDVTRAVARLKTVPGQPISGMYAPAGCSFAERCPLVVDECRVGTIKMTELAGRHVRCIRASGPHVQEGVR